jgi:hypothetical protein
MIDRAKLREEIACLAFNNLWPGDDWDNLPANDPFRLNGLDQAERLIRSCEGEHEAREDTP